MLGLARDESKVNSSPELWWIVASLINFEGLIWSDLIHKAINYAIAVFNFENIVLINVENFFLLKRCQMATVG